MSDTSFYVGDKDLTIAVIAVEPSGDLQGGDLVKAVKKINPNINFVGIGGPVMAQAGVNLWMNTVGLGVIGPGEAFLRLPEYLSKYWKIRNKLLAEKPDLTILIDSPAVNMRLAGVLRRFGLKSAYYFPPSAWTKNKARLEDIFGRTDKVICTFKGNAELYKQYGMEVDYFGHPMIDMPELELSKEQAQEKIGIFGKILGLLPGSREQEVQHLLPVFLETAEILHQEDPELKVVIPCATSELEKKIFSAVSGKYNYIHIVSGSSRLVMLASEALLMSSGTASLEAAVLKTPMALCYRFGFFNACLGKLLLWLKILKIDHIGLPSLVAGRRIVPEYIQEEACCETLVPVMRSLLSDTPMRRQMLEDLAEVKVRMGEPGCVAKIADSVYQKALESHAELADNPADIVITSNSPGEVYSWVKSTALSLKSKIGVSGRIIVALVPCPYASGTEAQVLDSFKEIDIVFQPKQTLRLMFGFSVKGYKPAAKGVVVFLGGDPMHAVLLSRQLHYKSVAYAVKDNIALRLFSAVCTDCAELAEYLRAKGIQEVSHIGNLCIERAYSEVSSIAASSAARSEKCIGIFPGSRFLHFQAALGPFLRVAARIKALRPDTRFVLSVSPFISDAKFKWALKHPLHLGLASAEGTAEGNKLTVFCSEEAGNCGESFQIEIMYGTPYEAMSKIDMALAIPGTNNGELACCGIPISVGLSSLVPFPRGGLGGLIDRMPGMESLKRFLRSRSYKHYKFASQPNRAAGRMLVPEIVVEKDILVLAEPLIYWLDNEDKRLEISEGLKSVMEPVGGAGEKMAEVVIGLVN